MTGVPGGQAIGPGRTLGHYTVLDRLGRGGMGEVFLARDTRLGRPVAVKVLSPEFSADSRRVRRFESEAKALAALNHPNIVSIFSIEHIDGHYLLIMERIDGETLRRRMPPEGLPVDQFLDIAVRLADAVGAAHEQGVTHRDLKPENVMVTHSGWVKVLDFGLAKVRQDAHGVAIETGVTSAGDSQGFAIGTVPYMSPEQIEGDPVDHRSDIFSLGVLLHEMLTGGRPFEGRSNTSVMSAILRDPPPPVTAKRPDAPPQLNAIVARCLAKSPGARYQSAFELRDQLRDVAREIELHHALATPAGRRAIPTRRDEVGLPARLLTTRLGLLTLLLLLWTVNWIETTAESVITPAVSASWLGYDIARAFSWFERELNFERHDLAGPFSVYAGAAAYFFVPVVLLAVTLVSLWRRSSIDGLRIFVLAITTSYTVSLLFYLFLPVPERWVYPESQAILLSDLWTARLIETIRPVSGIDNCFPSFHVSGTFDLVLVWFLLRRPFRYVIGFLGAAVAISTVLLGIHWVADVVAGLGLALASVWVGVRLNARLGRAFAIIRVRR